MSLAPGDRARADRATWTAEPEPMQLDAEIDDDYEYYQAGCQGQAPSPNQPVSPSASPTYSTKNSAPTPENLKERLSQAMFHGRNLMVSTSPRDKSKKTFHRVFGSLFGTATSSSTHAETNLHRKASERAAELLQRWRRPETFARRESSSSLTLDWPSGRGLTFHGSTPSLELVGPETFLFSGPSLGSTSSSTLANSSSIVRSDSDNSLDCAPLRGKRRCLATALPLELILQIYGYLAPRDFNAARRTCRSWMLASLERGMLTLMLQRGGWSCGAHGGLRSQGKSNSEGKVSEEWLLSRKISRECALSGNWTGNGLRSFERTDRRGASYDSCMVEAANIDFTGLIRIGQEPDEADDNGLVFTVSNCGVYLLVATGTKIFVYVLKGPSLVPLTSVACPRRILAMSMDASTRRLAVAALLEGRMGIVCDLQQSDLSPDASISGDHSSGARPLSAGDVVESSSGYRTTTRASLFSSRLYPSNDRTTFWEPPRRLWPTVVEHGQPTPPNEETSQEDRGQPTEYPNMNVNDQASIADQMQPQPTLGRSSQRGFNSIEVQSEGRNIEVEDADDPQYDNYNIINQTWNVHLRGLQSDGKFNTQKDSRAAQIPKPVPLETGPRTMYRQLCSDDDPPRSVAICPQRRCVAFGCSAGIELHWVDALTGQDLHRWFPLTAPSDFLYFLNPRPGVDSSHKLRIISSVANTNDRLARRRFSPTIYTTFGSNCDHYRAVPLSDGYHHLFTDPPSQMLHLGSDAPLGGSIKLLRKIAFEAPSPGLLPTAYAASSDLSHGARVVAGFGNLVVLYSVPSDVLAASRAEQKGETGPGVGCSCGNGDACRAGCVCWPWLEWWPEEDRDTRPCSRNRVPWPLSVHGVTLGSVEGLVDIAVNETPELTVWAIGESGRATGWKVDGGEGPVGVRRRVVLGDGRVVDGYQGDGDGNDLPRGRVRRSEDGVLGWHGAVSVGGGRADGSFEFQNGSWYDEDGDVIMLDAPAEV